MKEETNVMKTFDIWNEEKKRIDLQERSNDLFYHEREVWWCSIGLNVGVETDGKNTSFERPIVVVRKFNRHMFWGLPLTTNQKEGEFYAKINHGNTSSWVLLSQLRTWSSKRLLRKVGMISESDFESIAEKVKGFIGTNRPRLAAGSRRPKP